MIQKVKSMICQTDDYLVDTYTYIAIIYQHDNQNKFSHLMNKMPI